MENENQSFLLNVRNRLPDPQSKGPSSTEKDGIESGEPESSHGEDVQMTDELSIDAHESSSEAVYAEKLTKIRGILSGETSIQLTLQFLYSHNR